MIVCDAGRSVVTATGAATPVRWCPPAGTCPTCPTHPPVCAIHGCITCRKLPAAARQLEVIGARAREATARPYIGRRRADA